MRKVLHVFKCIILLAYLVFIVLCGHSCIMTLFRNSIPAASGADLSEPVAQTAAQPVAQPKNENDVSGVLFSAIVFMLMRIFCQASKLRTATSPEPFAPGPGIWLLHALPLQTGQALQ